MCAKNSTKGGFTMKQRSFHALLMIAAMLFAVVSLGGCGGSSDPVGTNTDPGGGGNEDSSLTMSDVWQDKEAAQEVVNRLNSGDIFLLLTVRMEAVEKKSDGSVTMKYYDVADSVFHDEVNPEVPYNAAEVRAHYNSGDVIVLLNTDLELVNTVRADLGLVSEDESNFGESGILEAYGLSCQRVDGLRNLFTYVVPKFGDLASQDELMPDEITEDDSTDEDLPQSDESQPEENEVIPEPFSMRELQIERWVRFLQWMGEMGVKALRNQASAAQIVAANQELSAIADAQTRTFDYTYNNTLNLSDWGGSQYTISRTNTVSYTIYSAHSFASGKDYYIVTSENRTVPKNFTDSYVEKDDWKHNFLWGYTRYFGVEQHIDDGNMGINDVALIRNTPSNLNQSKTYSDSTTWEVNGKVGVSKDGASAEVGGGFSHTNSLTWDVTEYKIINNCGSDKRASAKWYADVNTPDDGDKHYIGAPFRYYRGVNATAASRNQLQYDAAWMWEVGSSYWRNHPKMSMKVYVWSNDGFTAGWSHKGLKYRDRTDQSWEKSKSFSLTLNQPAHTATSQRTFGFTSRAAKGQTFTLLAEDSWTISDIPAWITFTETSGPATGNTDKLILFDISENTTSGPRHATMTITSGRDKLTIEVAQSATPASK